MQTNTTIFPVTVIGAGRMGSALVRALLKTGRQVTVWNRDIAKARPLESDGAHTALALLDAVHASHVLIICIVGYEAWRNLLAGLPPDCLQGKTIIQLSTGAADDAVSLANTHQQMGALSLDGSIDTYPSEIGTDKGQIKIAGDLQVFEANQELLGSLGAVQYVGADIATAAALENASVFFTATAFLGYFQGAVFFEKLGIPLTTWTAVVSELMPARADWLQAMEAAMVAHDHRGSEATLVTFQSAWKQMIDQAKRLNMRTDFIEAIDRLTREGIEKGVGDQEFSAHFELLRSAN